jgi:hypothetical protein
MAEEKRSLWQRLKYWLFGRREANRAEQKERRDDLTNFLQEHEEEKQERADAAREKRS